MEGAAPAILSLEQVIKRRIGRDRSFELVIERLALRPGQVLAVQGPSGCGKSTLIDLLALALAPDSAGHFLLAGSVDVAALWRRRAEGALSAARARTFGYVLQTGGLLPFLTVRQNIELPARLVDRLQPAHIEETAARLGIADLLREWPERLSVGQRQRVAIARAVAARPAVVLADEPTASLDPANAAQVMALLLDLVRQNGSALLLATHDGDLAEDFSLPRLTCRLSESPAGVRSVFAMAA